MSPKPKRSWEIAVNLLRYGKRDRPLESYGSPDYNWFALVKWTLLMWGVTVVAIAVKHYLF